MIFVTCNLLHDKSVIQANKLISFIGEKVMPNSTLYLYKLQNNISISFLAHRS